MLHNAQAVTGPDTSADALNTDGKDASPQQAEGQAVQQQTADIQDGQQQPPNKKVRLPLPQLIRDGMPIPALQHTHAVGGPPAAS